jgi:hypothetical protein
MTPAQCRAGRALVEFTQPVLAQSAGLGLSTVVDFERSRRAVSAAAVRAMRTALEARGVMFIDENGEGPGVRLRKSPLFRPDRMKDNDA